MSARVAASISHIGLPPATSPTPTSHCDKRAFSRLAKLMSQASASSLPFPVARPRISAIETNGGARQAHQDVGPCLEAGRTLRDAGQILELREEVRVIKKDAVDGTFEDHHLHSVSSFSSAVTISRICETNSGPMRLSGGLSRTTRQYEGVTRSSLSCAVFVAEFIRASASRFGAEVI
jgi:hypothetical protein